MLKDFDKKLDLFAQLIVKIGLNLQPGQKLIVNGKNSTRGVSLEAAPLLRRVAHHAYKAGARLVDVIYDDPELIVERIKHAPADSFGEYPTSHTQAIAEYVAAGNALMTVYANDPGQFEGLDDKKVLKLQEVMEKHLKPTSDQLMLNTFNWCLIALPVPGWAQRMYPKLEPAAAMDALWELIFRLCRLDQPDPIAAWETHIHSLHTRGKYLTDKAYDALKYTAPGTDFTLGLPEGHIFESARITSTRGVPYVANLPTEEIFSMPHKERADGTVTATLPLSHAGKIIDGFSVTFKNGRVVAFKAKQNEDVLKAVLDTDEGARHLGEVALVPNSSPIAQSKMMFFNTLFDENAACHLALGRAYRSTMKGGEQMTAEQFAAAGGNDSLTHTDFMIGSGEMNIDGITKSGKEEPVMRKGEWAFAI
ncbi:MAG: aminopeptidase [Anaerolineales bacterium]